MSQELISISSLLANVEQYLQNVYCARRVRPIKIWNYSSQWWFNRCFWPDFAKSWLIRMRGYVHSSGQSCLTGARNTGINLVDYLFLWIRDDWLPEQHVARLMPKELHIAIVHHCSFQQRIRPLLFDRAFWTSTREEIIEEYPRRCMLDGVFRAWAKLYKRKLLIQCVIQSAEWPKILTTYKLYLQSERLSTSMNALLLSLWPNSISMTWKSSVRDLIVGFEEQLVILGKLAKDLLLLQVLHLPAPVLSRQRVATAQKSSLSIRNWKQTPTIWRINKTSHLQLVGWQRVACFLVFEN